MLKVPSVKIFTENFNNDFKDNTVLFAQQRSQLGHKQFTNALKNLLPRYFLEPCFYNSLRTVQSPAMPAFRQQSNSGQKKYTLKVNLDVIILVRASIWKCTWTRSWKMMIVSYKYPSFRPINLLQKFPYYVKESTERKNTEFLGWARSRIFLNAISLKSYFNLKISGS